MTRTGEPPEEALSLGLSPGAPVYRFQRVRFADEVQPAVPIRQWVLSFPYPVRFQLAYDAHLCAAVRRIFVRTLLGWLRERGESALPAAQGTHRKTPQEARLRPPPRCTAPPIGLPEGGRPESRALGVPILR